MEFLSIKVESSYYINSNIISYRNFVYFLLQRGRMVKVIRTESWMKEKEEEREFRLEFIRSGWINRSSVKIREQGPKALSSWCLSSKTINSLYFSYLSWLQMFLDINEYFFHTKKVVVSKWLQNFSFILGRDTYGMISKLNSWMSKPYHWLSWQS